MNNRYLVLQNSIIVDIFTTEMDFFDKTIYPKSFPDEYDTVVLDNTDTVFAVGDTWMVDIPVNVVTINDVTAAVQSNEHERALALLSANMFEPETINAIKTVGVNITNRVAETIREAVITSAPGQIAVYAEKEKEATRYLADPSPIDSEYPLLVHEATALNVTLAALATEILSTAAAWKTIAGKIEAVRISRNHQVNAATTQAEVVTIVTTAMDELNTVLV